MSAPAFAQPIPVPAAIVPMPMMTALAGAGRTAKTAVQSTVTTRKPATSRLSAPNTYVDHFWITSSVAWPSPETIKVSTTNTAIKSSVRTGASFAAAGVPNAMVDSDNSTNAAVVVLTVSQPRRDNSDTMVGPMLPRTPKIARDNVKLGACPRRPAIEITPTIANEPAAPTVATSSACQIARCWNATSVAPSGKPRMLMLAANQTQKSCNGWPLQSLSGTGSMPRASILPAPVDVTDEAIWASRG